MTMPTIGDIWCYDNKFHWLLLQEIGNPFDYHFVASCLEDGGRISRVSPIPSPAKLPKWKKVA